MRLSSEIGDPGYGAFREIIDRNGKVVVYLDGQELKEVQTADEEQGYVVVYVRDENGRMLRQGDEWARQLRHGNVRIIVTGMASDA